MALSLIRPSHTDLCAKAQSIRATDPEISGRCAFIKAVGLLDPARRLSIRAHDALAIQLQNN